MQAGEDELVYIDAVPADFLEPGESATVSVEGWPVTVTVANADGDWYAYESACPHQATPLGGLRLTRKTLLQCPEHGSMFDVATGRCVLASNDGWSGTLRTYPTRVVDGVVQVSLAYHS
ncbi:MAG: Rieske (2Fe-2S) protein [Actinomycetota bacterium]|nr:Rieske (2Fe-2S) protein [Actinomycetota bacterium]